MNSEFLADSSRRHHSRCCHLARELHGIFRDEEHLIKVLNGMLCDHPLLVCGDYIGTDVAGLGSNSHLSRSIGVLVERDAQPRTARADARPYFRRVLTDASREHEAVEASQGSCQRADLSRSTEYEQFYSFSSVRIVAREQCTHVA